MISLKPCPRDKRWDNPEGHMAKAYETDLLNPEPTDIFFQMCSGGDLQTLKRFLLNPQAMRHLRWYIEYIPLLYKI